MSKVIFKVASKAIGQYKPGKIWINFAISIWVSVLLNSVMFIGNLISYNNISASYPAGYRVRIGLAPLAFIIVEILLWISLISRKPGMKFFAITMGLIILVNPVFINIINFKQSGIIIFYELIFFYIAVSHLVFAIKKDDS